MGTFAGYQTVIGCLEPWGPDLSLYWGVWPLAGSAAHRLWSSGTLADITEICGLRSSVVFGDCGRFGSPGSISLCLRLLGGVTAAFHPHFQVHFMTKTHTLSLSPSHTHRHIFSLACPPLNIVILYTKYNVNIIEITQIEMMK